MFGIGIFEGLIFIVIVLFTILPFWKILQKMGYPGAMSFLLLIPGVNLFFPFFLAFAKWPIERKLEQSTPHAQV